MGSADLSEHITDFDSVFDNFFSQRFTCDKYFELVGKIFCDGLIIPNPGIYTTKPMEELRLFISKYFDVKSIKNSDRNDGSYFIRINDDKAHIDKTFAAAVLKMMQDLRVLTYDHFKEQGLSEK